MKKICKQQFMYNINCMNKKILIGLGLSQLISLIYMFFQEDWLLAFANGIGLISIFSIIISGYIFLEHFGYFDVFGYTFKKTYLVLSNKYGVLESSEKSRYASMYDYIQFKNERRQKPSRLFYFYTLIILIEGILLNLIYIYA